MKSKRARIFSAPAFWIVLASLIWAAAFAFDWAPILRGEGDWAWHLRPILDGFRIWPVVLSAALYIPVALWLRERGSATSLVTWSTLGAIGLTLAAVHARGDILYRLYSITVSGRSAGWHMAAAHISDLAATLRDWSRFMADSQAYSPHIDHTPPGIVIIYFAASQLLDSVPAVAATMAAPVRWMLCQYLIGYTDGQYASAWLGMLMPLWAGLTAVPLYILGKRVFSEQAARWASLWWALVPGILLFSPLPNTFYALPSVIVVAMLWEGLRRDQMAWIAFAGLLTSVLTFLTFTFAPLVLFSGLLALGVYVLKRRESTGGGPRWHWPLQVGLVFGAGLAVVWLLSYAVSGLSFWNLWQSAQQTQIDVAQVRAYWTWTILDLNDLFTFTGWPLVILALMGAWVAIRSFRGKSAPSEGAVMTLAALLTVLIIDLYGTPRGEWGRIMILMSPWLLLAAGSELERLGQGGWGITATQGVVACVMVVSLQVLAPEFRGRATPVPPDAKLPAVSPEMYVSNEVFDGSIRLTSAFGRIENQINADGNQASTLFLWLTWGTLKPVARPYAYSIQVTTEGGAQASPPATISPFQDAYPTTCWGSTQKPVTDRLKIPLSAPTAGAVWVDLAVVDPDTGQQLNVTSDATSGSTSIKLGPFH